jgi:hypothetical protein
MTGRPVLAFVLEGDDQRLSASVSDKRLPTRLESVLMRRLFFLPAALLLTLALAGTALAANPHQVGSTSVTVSGNSLTISAKIAGLGNVATATFDLGGTIDVSSRCYTKSGNKPQAANKQETISVSETGTFPVRNGTATPTFTVTPLSTLSCPPGQIVVIESVTYDLTISYLGDVLVTASGSF